MNGKLKIREIARQTGLSISTVSRVLAGKANTSEQAKQKILDCARQEGILEQMSTGRLLLNSLVVFAPQRAFDVRSDIFYFKVIQGIAQALAPHEVRLRYCALEEQSSNTALFMEKMNDPATEAAMLVGIDDPIIYGLAANIGKPCILINCRDRRMQLPGGSPDHQLIGRFSAQYLFEQGHRRILSILCLRRYTMEQRLNGIREAWQECNLEFDESRHLIITQGFGTSETEQSLAEYLRQYPEHERPTAILAGGDFMAQGAINALSGFGLHVPHDISIMSMDGFDATTDHQVPFTSVQVPCCELGMEAVRLLQQWLMRPNMISRTLLLNGGLILRNSVRRINSHKISPLTQEFGLYDA